MKNAIRAAFIPLFCLFFVMVIPFAAFATDDPPPFDTGDDPVAGSDPTVIFDITAVNTDIYTLGSMNDLCFLCSDTVATVYVNDTQLTNSDFNLSTGLNTVSLSAKYLDKRLPGMYTITVYSAAGDQASTIFTIKAAPSLTVTGGDPHTIGSLNDLSFICSDSVNTVFVDGQQLTKPAYVNLNGSAVTLFAAYLDQLAPGTHTISVYTAVGEQVSASFTIKTVPTLTVTGGDPHTRYSTNDLSFLCSDSISTVLVDGKKLTANFSFSQDGKTVTLSAAYLDQLTSGVHTVSVYTAAGDQASTNFWIDAVMTLTATGSDTHEPGSMNDLSFVCDGVIADAYVGGMQLNSADCGISGSGKAIILYAALLNKLKPDNLYTLRVYNAAGDSADATFKIADCPRLVPGTPLAADSEETLYFTVPENGYYRFDYQNGNTSYRFQVLDRQTGSWQNSPSMLNRQYAIGESIYVRPMYNQTVEGLLSVLVRKITPPAMDSIEVSAAYDVTNSSMTLDFTLSVTETTANNGFHLGLLWGPNPTLAAAGWSRDEFGLSYSVWNNEIQTQTRGDYVPGQSFYYTAILTDQMGTILAQGSTIHYVQFEDSLTGFQQLTLNMPYSVTNKGYARFYFEAPTDGVYAVTAEGVNAMNVKDKNCIIGGANGQSDYLFGTPIKAGERIYITTAQNTGQSGSVCIYEGLQKLPAATLGTQSVEDQALGGIRLPMRFTAPEDGLYSFTTNSAAHMQVMDESGNSLYSHVVNYYRTSLLKGQVLWISGMERAPGDTLTIVKETIPLWQLVFPAELTHLEDEACRGLLIDDVVFGDKIQSIGSKAFADCPNLRRVEIPVANVAIEDDAFSNSPNVILHAPIGGNVEQYAAEHHIMLEAMF